MVNNVKRTALFSFKLMKRSLLTLFFCLFSLHITALDPRQPIHHYLLDEWTGHAGLQNLSIYNIIQSADNFLWIETFGDIMRFDGNRFTEVDALILPFSKYNAETIYNLLLNDREGTLWLEGDKGLIKYRDNRFNEFIPLKSFPWEDFSLAVQDSWGNFWLGTSGGNLYCFKFKNRKLIEYGPGKGIPGTGISSILEDKHGNLWVAALESGIFKLKDGRFYPVNIKGITKKDTVTWLYEDRGGVLWIATSKGLFRKNNDEITLFTGKPGQTNILSKHKRITHIRHHVYYRG